MTTKATRSNGLMPTCEVCGKTEAIEVCSVPGVPYSAAYCKECLEIGAEPYNIVVANTACLGDAWPDGVVPDWHDIVNTTLKHLNITRAKFDADVEESIRNMDEYFRLEKEKEKNETA